MINRTIGLTLGLALALGVAAPAGAVTVAELQAQINALMAQLAALQGGTTTTTTVTFTQNLTLGSTGPEVTALQQYLVAQGHLTMPAGVAFGYFGQLTKAAVAKWQAANGVAPALGYWGAISRAKYVSMGGTPGTTTGGTTTGGSTTGISTPGVEGTITVSKNPSPASGVKLYENDMKKAVLGIKLEAKTSDIKVERVKLDLDETGDTASSDSAFYNKVAQKIYIMDGSTVLASADLNSSTVVEESNEISITLAGLNFIVPKDGVKVLTVAIDAKSSWDSTYNTDSWTVGVAENGVRGVDGAGVNQYGPSSAGAFLNTFTSEDDIADTSTLQVSTAANTPVATEVIASQGTSENELDGLELLKFNLKAEKGAVTVNDAVVTIARATADDSSNATSTTGYLYDGSTLLGSATIAGTSATAMTATFTDIDYVVPQDTTKTLTFKVDIDTADTVAQTFQASVAATTGITAERANGDALAETGSATGEVISVRKAGPQFSLVSSNVTYTAAQGGVAAATSTAKATFVINVKALGDDIVFGTQAASSTFNIATYKGGTETGFANSSTTNIIVPSSGVVTTGLLSTDLFKVSEGQDVNVTVEVIFPGRLDTGALLSTDAYAFGVDNIRWSTATTPRTALESNFMAGKTNGGQAL